MLLRFTFQALTSSNVRETFCWIAETPATRLHKSEKENWPDPDTEKAQEPRAVVTTPSCEAILRLPSQTQSWLQLKTTRRSLCCQGSSCAQEGTGSRTSWVRRRVS